MSRTVHSVGVCNAPSGIGSPLAEAPSHTTGHAGPHPAVRLIKADQELSSDSPSGFKQAYI